MQDLPQHSHYRAPLLATLSKGLPSSTAAQLFGTSASYVRDIKSKGKKRDWKETDLFQEKYAHDVKRQKLHPEVLTETMEFLVGACPTKSGEKSVTFYQYHTDDFLFNA